MTAALSVAAVSTIAESKRTLASEANGQGYAIQEELAIGSPVVNVVNHEGLHVYGVEVSSG